MPCKSKSAAICATIAYSRPCRRNRKAYQMPYNAFGTIVAATTAGVSPPNIALSCGRCAIPNRTAASTFSVMYTNEEIGGAYDANQLCGKPRELRHREQLKHDFLVVPSGENQTTLVLLFVILDV
jgi:hypothetical protein